MFEIGQQVVCINDKWTIEGNHIRPVRGCVYTIRSFRVLDDCLGLRFEEIVNPSIQFSDGYFEVSFISDFFRPVRKTNIDVFTQILNNTPIKEYEYVEVRNGSKK